ncbi:MAG TPA: glycosyl hydrolase-related protein [Fimbriimonadaceae bacterium]|nr:glycosyl hydrolase-related protein [Fimbriimonadaceae bacterium]
MDPLTRSRLLKSLQKQTAEAERWLHRIENEIAFARAFTIAVAKAGSGFVSEPEPEPPAKGDGGSGDGSAAEGAQAPVESSGPSETPATGVADEAPLLGDRNWIAAIDRAQAIIEDLPPVQSLDALRDAVTRAEAEMAEIGRAARDYTIHCVGHGHIDMNWMWSWPETVSMTHDTFASVLSLMEQYPELTYSQSQASVYEAIERYHPAMFDEIRARVKEGRWEVTATQWVEGDKNLASGEALCRHLLYTRNYFRDKFGLEPEDVPVQWEPDTFGHANTIPMISSAGAVKYYYACRTGGGFEHWRVGEERPPLFWWQAPDGSRILVNRELTWYNSYVNIGANIALPMCRMIEANGLHEWMNVYGIGNHGGGPTRDEIEFLISMRDWPVYPRVVFSTARRYFEAVEAEVQRSRVQLPVIDHELNFEFTGCYTSQSLIKQANRLGENYCVEAETLDVLRSCAAAGDADAEQGRAARATAWINVLFNQFHDILPGSGVRETREHARALFQETGAITGAIKREALKALCSGIDTLSMLPDTPEGREERELFESNQANTAWVAGSGIGARLSGYSQSNGGGKHFKPVVIYNSCAWERSEVVQVALYDTDFDEHRIVAMDAEGKAYPTMSLGKGRDWGHDKITLLVPAVDVPALGYKTLLLCEGVADAEIPTVTALGNEKFETPHLHVEFNRHDGGWQKLWLKKGADQDSELCIGRGGRWQHTVERDRIMSAWVLGDEVSAEEPARSSSFRTFGPLHNEATLLTDKAGLLACRAEWQLVFPGTQSTAKVKATVHGLAPVVEFEAELDWREIGSKENGIPGLVISFPGPHCDPAPVYETPFGSVSRGSDFDDELPSLRFVSSPAHDMYPGVTLLQDSKYGFGGGYDELKMRVIRSSFDPDHAPEVNKQTFRYSVYLHDKPAKPSELTRLGAAFNHPLIVAPANMQSGREALEHSFAEVISDSVLLTSMKPSEHGDGVVVRLVEYDGGDVEAEVRFSERLARNYTRATLVDVLERPVEGAVTWADGVLRVPIRAHGFVSVLLTGG